MRTFLKPLTVLCLAMVLGIGIQAQDVLICVSARLWLSPTTLSGDPSAPAIDTGFNPSGKSYSYVAQGSSVAAFRNVAEDGFPAGGVKWTWPGSVPILFKSAIGCASGHAQDDVIFVITHNQCGDTTRNRVIAYWASNLAVKWVFNASVPFCAEPPLAVAITQASSQPDPASRAPIMFTAVFTRPVTGFASDDVVFTGSTVGGTLAASVRGSGALYEVGVTDGAAVAYSITATDRLITRVVIQHCLGLSRSGRSGSRGLDAVEAIL